MRHAAVAPRKLLLAMNEKPCALITIIPPALETEWAAKLTEFASRFKPAAVILQAPSQKSAAELIAKAKPLELAVLFADAVEQVKDAAASGVYFSALQGAVLATRQKLGSEAIIGAACGLSRHDAMEFAEAGADFVAFEASEPSSLDEAAALSRWWDEITGIPSALLLGKFRPPRSALEEARPDFLIVQEESHPGESLTFATELGLQSQK
jgi:thiamine-phosphate pyrophosphorylase